LLGSEAALLNSVALLIYSLYIYICSKLKTFTGTVPMDYGDNFLLLGDTCI
jgi:hypothetical protein